jgi:lysyl-tRNA synthetase class 2
MRAISPVLGHTATGQHIESVYRFAGSHGALNIRIVPSCVYDGEKTAGVRRDPMLYSPFVADNLRARLQRQAQFIRTLRAFFEERGYLEVDTPTLSPVLIPEPSIEVFQTSFRPARGGEIPLWLIPSPELWMKRLLAAGSGNIFQVSRCFRNGDFGGPHHNPEFRLLECYTIDAGSLDSIPLIEGLFSRLVLQAPPGPHLERLAPPFSRLTMEEAFRHYAGIELAKCRDARAMKEAGIRSGAAMPPDPTWEEAFHIAFLTLVEPHLPRARPLVLTDYPSLIPTTARARQGTPWCERWELYVDGVEIANCYTEETDPRALRTLLEEEARRKMSSRVLHRIDYELADLFPTGFPVCSGVALGVDRLEMVLRGENSLEGVILFPFSAIMRPQSETG